VAFFIHYRAAFLFGLSAIAAIFAGRFLLSPEQASQVVGRWGYWWILLPFLLLLVELGRMVWLRRRELRYSPIDPAKLSGRLAPPVLFLCLLFAVLWQSQDKEWKFVMDEPVLASTALTMHEERHAFYSVDGLRVNGEYFASAFAVDKRPLFYPFLVSLLHDWTGYRPQQAILLNGALLAGFLILTFACGRFLLRPYGGYLLSALFGTVPLLAIVATGGIFDLLNLVMILALGFAMCHYLSERTDRSMNVMLLLTVLLAQTRYESVLFVLPVGLAVLVSWLREREVKVTKTLVLTPLLLVPVLLQNQMMEANPANWHFREGDEVAFAAGYLSENLGRALAFFTSADRGMPNSLLLTLGFVAALVAGAIGLARHRDRLRAASPVALTCIGLGAVVLINFGMLMFYHWGQIDDIMASRLVMPFLLLQSVVCLLALASWKVRASAQLCCLGAIVIFFLLQTRPSLARSHLFAWADTRSYAEEVLAFASEQAVGNDLIIASNSLPAYLARRSSMTIRKARDQLDRVALHHDLGTFSKIYLLFLEPTPLADVERVGKLEKILEEKAAIDASFDYEIRRREKLNEALYLVEAEAVGVRESAYQPIELDLGDLEVNKIGALSSSKPEIWQLFSDTLPL